MTDDQCLPGAEPGVTRLVSLDELEQLWQRQVGPFLANLRQTAVQLVDDLANRNGLAMLAQVRQTIAETIEATLKSQESTLWAQLRPALNEGTDALRQKTDTLLANLKQMIAATVIEVFRIHVPEYSRWAGQRIMDYFLASMLFGLALVLAAVGGVLGLEAAGFPRYATYLTSGGIALGAGLVFLKLRSSRWGGIAQVNGRQANGKAKT